MTLAVVILNWNGRQLLEQFLPLVIKHSQQASIYVADNASTDDSIPFVQSNFPEVKIIKNKENGGYAKGYNDALKYINEELICLLNSDVEVTKNWLSPIIETFNNNEKTAIVQPKVLDYNRKSHFEYAGAAGGFIDKYGYPYCRGRIFNTIEEDKGQFNDITDVFWASGACLFIKTDVFNKLGGFDEYFFAHMEEIDLCWRAYNAGYQIKYNGHSTIYHVGGATLNNSNPRKTFLNFRNSLLTLTKNASGNIFGLIVTRLILDGVAGIQFLLQLKPQHTFAIVKAHFSYYKHLNKALKFRKLHSTKLKYYQKTSVVFAYFINKKRVFNSL